MKSGVALKECLKGEDVDACMVRERGESEAAVGEGSQALVAWLHIFVFFLDLSIP